MNLSSEWRNVNGNAAKVFGFVSNLANMGALMPEQVINWKADQDRCSFTIKGMTNLSLKIDEKKPDTFLRLIPDGKSPFEFELLVHVKETSENSSKAMVELNAELNPMLAMMAKRPLQHLVSNIAEKLSLQQF